ncbi:ImmA/IrrE family metallo-endopeptidase [Phyllobacterium calauticae]|jgi:Zn-dependent peptidase ImmA (M78 family)|uniref:ImmA/IrrE family metallo-endopeptidase n=1 Tax=Phyllobacterium calauticae TaxID=2817027 RepID=UPI001CBAEFB7|nr:ImmA/IrrE family metallo-endopeptidase [Phyllobacterium calauticae]MBZ3693395.1 ImmA/IrrE family metallo-endopeptidase [Phyllobacterium calauticae]
MSSQNYIVPPRSWDNIGAMCDRLRVQFSLAEEPNFPVMQFLEKVLYEKMEMVELRIRSKEEMGAYEGYTDPEGKFIALRQDVYENAWEENGRDRFTVAHELGHYFLHTGMPMARASDDRREKAFILSEPQANQFAAELLMPRCFIELNDTVQTIMSRHAVSNEAAQNRLRFMNSRWEKIRGSVM